MAQLATQYTARHSRAPSRRVRPPLATAVVLLAAAASLAAGAAAPPRATTRFDIGDALSLLAPAPAPAPLGPALPAGDSSSGRPNGAVCARAAECASGHCVNMACAARGAAGWPCGDGGCAAGYECRSGRCALRGGASPPPPPPPPPPAPPAATGDGGAGRADGAQCSRHAQCAGRMCFAGRCGALSALSAMS